MISLTALQWCGFCILSEPPVVVVFIVVVVAGDCESLVGWALQAAGSLSQSPDGITERRAGRRSSASGRQTEIWWWETERVWWTDPICQETTTRWRGLENHISLTSCWLSRLFLTNSFIFLNTTSVESGEQISRWLLWLLAKTGIWLGVISFLYFSIPLFPVMPLTPFYPALPSPYRIRLSSGSWQIVADKHLINVFL